MEKLLPRGFKGMPCQERKAALTLTPWKSSCWYDHVLEPERRSGACRERRAATRFRVAALTLTAWKGLAGLCGHRHIACYQAAQASAVRVCIIPTGTGLPGAPLPPSPSASLACTSGGLGAAAMEGPPPPPGEQKGGNSQQQALQPPPSLDEQLPPWKVPLLLPRSRRAGTLSSRHSSLLLTSCRH